MDAKPKSNGSRNLLETSVHDWPSNYGVHHIIYTIYMYMYQWNTWDGCSGWHKYSFVVIQPVRGNGLAEDGSKHKIRLSIHDAARGTNEEKKKPKKKDRISKISLKFSPKPPMWYLYVMPCLWKSEITVVRHAKGTCHSKVENKWGKKRGRKENQKCHASGNHKEPEYRNAN